MSYQADFVDVSTIGLETSPFAAALAGLRANEARYFKNKFDHVFVVELADSAGRQKSKLAGTIRGSYFVIEGEY